MVSKDLLAPAGAAWSTFYKFRVPKVRKSFRVVSNHAESESPELTDLIKPQNSSSDSNNNACILLGSSDPLCDLEQMT